MFSKNNKSSARMITVFSDLDIGDLVVFKPREILPCGISDETLSLEKVGSYDYGGKLISDFTLLHSSGLRYSAVYNTEEDTITIGNKLRRSEVVSIFDENSFADIFNYEYGDFELCSISKNISHQHRPWVAEAYKRSVTSGIAYYYENDRRRSGVSQYEDHSQPFTYFELEGNNNVNSLSIEVWADGETDVFLEITVKANVVETFLSHA